MAIADKREHAPIEVVGFSTYGLTLPSLRAASAPSTKNGSQRESSPTSKPEPTSTKITSLPSGLDLGASRPTLSAQNAERVGHPRCCWTIGGKGWATSANSYGRTLKATLLKKVPLGVFTRTLPVVAPAGTVATMSVGPLTLNVAVVP